MSFVGDPFLHDLFITYCHGSDATGAQSYLRGWSQRFAKTLESEMRFNGKFRNDLRVYFDTDDRRHQGIDPMKELKGQLLTQVGGAAVLVVMMSPDYLGSKWCERERDWWHEAQKGHKLQVDGRLCVVRILSTDQEWPALLVDADKNQLVGFKFNSLIKGVERPLGYLDKGELLEGAAQEAIIEIVGHLSSNLADIRSGLEERRKAEEAARKLADVDNLTVYLHGRADHRKAWDCVAADLQDSGFAVFPDGPEIAAADPSALRQVRDDRITAMSTCDALMLVAGEDGRALDQDLVIVGRQDRNSARERSNRLLPCALIDTVGHPIATDFRRKNARNLQTEWIDATDGPWVPKVQSWLVASGNKHLGPGR